MSIKAIPINEELAFRADQLDYILSENNPDTSAQYCDYMASSEFLHDSNEKDSWKFLKRLFSPASRDDMTDFVGYDQNFSNEDRLASLVKKLHIHPLESSEGATVEQTSVHAPLPSSEPALPFSFYSSRMTEDSDIDSLITKAIIVGDFELAVSVCLGANRHADALVLAANGTPELLLNAQNQYFKHFASKKSYVRVLQAVVKGDLSDLISNSRLDSADGWKDLISLICTYAKPADFSMYFGRLGARLNDVSFTGIKDQVVRDHASALCFMGAGDLVKVVSIWARGISAEVSPSNIQLQSLVERLSLFRQAIHYEDPSLALESDPESVTRLKYLYEVYVNYAWTASVQGKQDVAWRFLEHVPLNFIPESGIDLSIIRDRVYANRNHVLAVTGQPPLFPFEKIDVVNIEAQRRASELTDRQQQSQASKLTHFQNQSNYNVTQQPFAQPPYGSQQPSYGAQPGYAGQQQSYGSQQSWNPPNQQEWSSRPGAPVQSSQPNNWIPTPNVGPPPVNTQWNQQPVASPWQSQQSIQPPPVMNQWQPQQNSNISQWTPSPPVAASIQPAGSTGHAAPMPSTHFQPPIVSPPQQTQFGEPSTSMVAPPPVIQPLVQRGT